jgi:hypothetical protein
MPPQHDFQLLSHENMNMILGYVNNGSARPRGVATFSSVCRDFDRHARLTLAPLRTIGDHITTLSTARRYDEIVRLLKTVETSAQKQLVIMLALLACDAELFIRGDFVHALAHIMRAFRGNEGVQIYGCRILCLKNQYPSSEFFTAEPGILCNALLAFGCNVLVALPAMQSLAMHIKAYRRVVDMVGGMLFATVHVDNRLRQAFCMTNGSQAGILMQITACITSHSQPDFSEIGSKIVLYGCQMLANLLCARALQSVSTDRARELARNKTRHYTHKHAAAIMGISNCMLHVMGNNRIHRHAAFLHDYDAAVTTVDTIATAILTSLIRADAIHQDNLVVSIVSDLIRSGNTSKLSVLAEYFGFADRQQESEACVEFLPVIISQLQHAHDHSARLACIPCLDFLCVFSRNNRRTQDMLLSLHGHSVLRDMLYATKRVPLDPNLLLDVSISFSPAEAQKRADDLLRHDAQVTQIQEAIYLVLQNFFSMPMTPRQHVFLLDCFMPENHLLQQHIPSHTHTLRNDKVGQQDTVAMRQTLKCVLFARECTQKKATCCLLMLGWMFSIDNSPGSDVHIFFMKKTLFCLQQYDTNTLLIQGAFVLLCNLRMDCQNNNDIACSATEAVRCMSANESSPSIFMPCIYFLHRLSQHPVHAVMLNVDLVQTYVARLVQLAAPGNSVHLMELLHEIRDKLTIQQHQMPPRPSSATRILF